MSVYVVYANDRSYNDMVIGVFRDLELAKTAVISNLIKIIPDYVRFIDNLPEDPWSYGTDFPDLGTTAEFVAKIDSLSNYESKINYIQQVLKASCTPCTYSNLCFSIGEFEIHYISIQECQMMEKQ